MCLIVIVTQIQPCKRGNGFLCVEILHLEPLVVTIRLLPELVNAFS